MPSAHPTPPRRRVLLLLAYHLTATEQGVMKYAREAGWTLDLRMLRSGVLPEPGGIDGILCLLGGWESRPDLAEYVRNAAVPVVDMHADEAGRVPAGRVLMNNRTIGKLAAQHFATRGFTRCLFCCRSLSDLSARQRRQGFVAALDQKGIAHRTFGHVQGKAKKTPVGDLVPQLMTELDGETAPLGVFAENDDVAALVLDACDRLGFRVPEQVAVLGCGNDPLVVDYTRVPLSSVDPDSAGRSYRASQLLDRLMNGEPVPLKPLWIEPLGIVTRQSTDIMAVPDLRVAGALSHIRRHFTNPSLHAEVVASSCGVPSRTLSRLFKEHLNRSVADEIARLRREQAQQRLDAGDGTATEIAHACGFASLLHMRRNFQRHLGSTPRAWRQRKEAARKKEREGRKAGLIG